jgi:hypothetical protein
MKRIALALLLFPLLGASGGGHCDYGLPNYFDDTQMRWVCLKAAEEKIIVQPVAIGMELDLSVAEYRKAAGMHDGEDYTEVKIVITDGKLTWTDTMTVDEFERRIGMPALRVRP